MADLLTLALLPLIVAASVCVVATEGSLESWLAGAAFAMLGAGSVGTARRLARDSDGPEHAA